VSATESGATVFCDALTRDTESRVTTVQTKCSWLSSGHCSMNEILFFKERIIRKDRGRMKGMQGNQINGLGSAYLSSVGRCDTDLAENYRRCNDHVLASRRTIPMGWRSSTSGGLERLNASKR